MARAKPKFTVLDIQRAMAGAKRAGFEVAQCEVAPDGTISVITMAGAKATPASPAAPESALQRWKREERESAAERALEKWD